MALVAPSPALPRAGRGSHRSDADWLFNFLETLQNAADFKFQESSLLSQHPNGGSLSRHGGGLGRGLTSATKLRPSKTYPKLKTHSQTSHFPLSLCTLATPSSSHSMNRFSR